MDQVRRITIGLLAALALWSCTSTPPPAPSTPPGDPSALGPPRAEQRPYTVRSPHGDRVDPYYWLRDDQRQDPAVLGYLEAENAYWEQQMAPLRELEEQLYREIVGRIKQDDSTVPAKYKDYWYYTRFAEGQEYPIIARRRGSADGPEEIMLDVNQLAAGHDYYQIGNWEVSPNQRLLAYAEDTVGRRQYTLRVKDLASGTTLPLAIPGSSGAMAWADDDRTLFYVENDPVTLLSKRVKRHRLGTDPAQDEVVYEERDPSFYLAVGRSSSDRYLAIVLESTVSNEVHVLRADRPDGRFELFAPRERGIEYDIDHLPGRWIIRTNWQAQNFRLMEVTEDALGDRRRWREMVPHDPAVYIGGFALFRDFLVISERSEGLQRLRIRPWHGGESYYLASEQPVYVATLGTNLEQDTPLLRYHYSSLNTPNTVYEFDTRTRERRVLKRDPVLGEFDPVNYRTERLWVAVRDGTRVPVSLLYRKDFVRDGRAALYQFGYGAYGASMETAFSSPRLSLVDRGVVFAIAHVRGGQEMGRHWYEQGRQLQKMNTFHDFIDVTEALVAQGYAAADRVAAMGGSAGGLLIGAVANMRPELYRVMVAHVPFVDVVTTMLDESIPLTTNEFDEWGNPKQAEFYRYMLSYSPYDNVRRQAYPAMYVTTGLWDSQVQYWEPAKWVARLRTQHTGEQPILFRTHMEAGHGGRSGRFQRFREIAQEYAFVLNRLGIP